MTTPPDISVSHTTPEERAGLSRWVRALRAIDDMFFARREAVCDAWFRQREAVQRAGAAERAALEDTTLPQTARDAFRAQSRRRQDAYIEKSLERERRYTDSSYRQEAQSKWRETPAWVSGVLDRQLMALLPALPPYAIYTGNGDKTMTLDELKAALSYEGTIGLFKVDSNANGLLELNEVVAKLPRPGSIARRVIVRLA